MYIDIAIILILLFSIYRGYRKGVVRSIFRFAFTVGSMVISWFYVDKAVVFFDEHTTMRSTLTDFLLRYVRGRVQASADGRAAGQLPSILSSYLDSGSLIMTNAMVAPLVDKIIHVVAFFILFIAFRIVLRIIEVFLYRVLLKSVIMKSINRGLGLALGIIKGVLTSYLLILALVVIGVLGNVTPVLDNLNHSLSTGFFMKSGLMPYAEEFLDPPTIYKNLDLSSLIPITDSDEDVDDDEMEEPSE